MLRARWILLGSILSSACASGPPASRCLAEVWEGECQLASVTKVEDAEFPIPHVVLEAVYQPVRSDKNPAYTPGALAKKTWAKAQHELLLYDYLESNPRVACRTETPAAGGACVAGPLVVSVPEFDANAAAQRAAAPPVTGCAQIEATSTQDKLRGGQKTQTFVTERVHFAESSAELPPDAESVTASVAKLLESNPRIECLGIVGQVSMGEPPALAETRAKAVRDLLGAHGVSLSRLLTVGVTAKVFGTGARPEEGDPADRKVGFSVLLEAPPPP
jgi:outer membrane protein OmpA-like peptidoglycan-associated protein